MRCGALLHLHCGVGAVYLFSCICSVMHAALLHLHCGVGAVYLFSCICSVMRPCCTCIVAWARSVPSLA